MELYQWVGLCPWVGLYLWVEPFQWAELSLWVEPLPVSGAVPVGGTIPSEWSHSLYSAHNLFLDFSCPVLSERTQKVLIGYLSGTPRTSCPCAVAVSSSVLASRRAAEAVSECFNTLQLRSELCLHPSHRWDRQVCPERGTFPLYGQILSLRTSSLLKFKTFVCVYLKGREPACLQGPGTWNSLSQVHGSRKLR